VIPTPNDAMSWQDEYLLGYGPMDATHQEFVQQVGRLQAAPDAQLPALLDELLAHTRAHFDEENRWMRETQFPPADCHIEQHDAVLASMVDVQRLLVQEGRVDLCRSLVEALADWFPGHATHLDSALAHWMFKRQFGGKPVVLRRVIAGGAPASD
jgi:hemerythrin